MKPVILGSTNPRSKDPAHALWPDPPGCSGHRLWTMIYDVCGMTAAEYVETYDRRNLLVGTWCGERAVAAAKDFVPRCRGRTVVMLGVDVARAIGFDPDPGVKKEKFDATWYHIPHPSGRNAYYNDAMNRWNAGRLLADLAGRK